jgi:hypothetical protein
MARAPEMESIKARQIPPARALEPCPSRLQRRVVKQSMAQLSRAQMNQKKFQVRMPIAIAHMLTESFCMRGRDSDLKMCPLDLAHLMTASRLLGTRILTAAAGSIGATKRSGEEIGTPTNSLSAYLPASTSSSPTMPPDRPLSLPEGSRRGISG